MNPSVDHIDIDRLKEDVLGLAGRCLNLKILLSGHPLISENVKQALGARNLNKSASWQKERSDVVTALWDFVVSDTSAGIPLKLKAIDIALCNTESVIRASGSGPLLGERLYLEKDTFHERHIIATAQNYIDIVEKLQIPAPTTPSARPHNAHTIRP